MLEKIPERLARGHGRGYLSRSDLLTGILPPVNHCYNYRLRSVKLSCGHTKPRVRPVSQATEICHSPEIHSVARVTVPRVPGATGSGSGPMATSWMRWPGCAGAVVFICVLYASTHSSTSTVTRSYICVHTYSRGSLAKGVRVVFESLSIGPRSGQFIIVYNSGTVKHCIARFSVSRAQRTTTGPPRVRAGCQVCCTLIY